MTKKEFRKYLSEIVYDEQKLRKSFETGAMSYLPIVQSLYQNLLDNDAYEDTIRSVINGPEELEYRLSNLFKNILRPGTIINLNHHICYSKTSISAEIIKDMLEYLDYDYEFIKKVEAQIKKE